MKKVFEWTLGNGNKARIEAEYTCAMKPETMDFDGWETEGNPNPHESGSLTAYVDNKRVDTCYLVDFWKLIDTPQGIKKIWGLNIGFTAENAEKYEKFIATLIADGTSEEAKQYRASAETKKLAKEIETAKQTIKDAEAQPSIPTVAEYKVWCRNYNNSHNEGGDGYIPTLVTREEYEAAKTLISTSA